MRFLARFGLSLPLCFSSTIQQVSLSLVFGESVDVSRAIHGGVYVCVERCACVPGSNGTRFFFILFFFLVVVVVAISMGANVIRLDCLALYLSQSLEKSTFKIASISLSSFILLSSSFLLVLLSSSLSSPSPSSSSSSSDSSSSSSSPNAFFVVHRHASIKDLGVTSFPFSSRITLSSSTTPFNSASPVAFFSLAFVFLVKLFLTRPLPPHREDTEYAEFEDRREDEDARLFVVAMTRTRTRTTTASSSTIRNETTQR